MEPALKIRYFPTQEQIDKSEVVLNILFWQLRGHDGLDIEKAIRGVYEE